MSRHFRSLQGCLTKPSGGETVMAGRFATQFGFSLCWPFRPPEGLVPLYVARSALVGELAGLAVMRGLEAACVALASKLVICQCALVFRQ